ncbi:hypothetical protein ACTXK7_14530 [Vreelandella alkaliphila]
MSKTDRYRQSTWLEFMYRRLELARDLLTSDGVINFARETQSF